MSGGIKFRLVAFVSAIGIMVTLIVWTAHTSWERIAELQQKLTSVQLKSFQIADHFQQTILELNNTVLRYAVSHDPADWARFDVDSKALDHWIDEQGRSFPRSGRNISWIKSTRRTTTTWLRPGKSTPGWIRVPPRHTPG